MKHWFHRHRTGLAAAGIVLAGIIAYFRCLDAPFIFDDKPAIVDNASIRDLTRLDRVLQPPANGASVSGRPVVNLSLAINYAIGGLAPRGYHIANLGFHLLGALTLFGLLRRLLAGPALPEWLRRSAEPAAFAVALLWTVHPLQSETVICTVQRTESLVSLFYLVTFYGFCRAVSKQGSGRWLTVALLACLTGMATKEVMVTAPVVLVVFDRTFFAGTFRAAWQQRGRWHLAFAATWLLLAYLLFHTGEGQRGQAAGFGLGVTPWSYLLTQAHAIVLYLKLSVWPHPLIVDYGIWLATGVRDVLVQLVVVAALVVATGVALVRWPRVGFAGVWFFGILAPSSSVVPLVTQTIAEHRMHLPLAAVLTLLVLGGFRLLGRHMLPLTLALAVIATVGTIRRCGDFESELTLWSDLAAKDPDNGWAPLFLGNALLRLERFAEAEQAFRTAVQLMPRHPDARNGLGLALTKLNRAPEALEHLGAAVNLKPDFPQARLRLGLALLAVGQTEPAVEQFAAAVALVPEYADAEANWGVALFQLGRFAEAIPHLERALRLGAESPDSHYNLALALAAEEQVAAALPHFIAATRLRPADGAILLNLGGTYLRLGQPADAVPVLERAVELLPASAVARSHLGDALGLLGRIEEVIPHYEAAVRLAPDQPALHFNLASALLRLDRRAAAREHFLNAWRLDPTFTAAREMAERLQAPP